MKKHRRGFTLAEVLITLVVIGIVAAMTIPVIFANHRKEETTARLKKFYSTLNQVVLMARAEGNDWDYWADSASASSDSTSQTVEEFAKEYLLPYLSFQKYEIKNNLAYIYLNDGSYFRFRKAACIDFNFDINGDKKPNEFGRDKFLFFYCPDSVSDPTWESRKVIAYLPKNMTRAEILSRCKSSPDYCSGLLLLDNWQFKKDYPYQI